MVDSNLLTVYSFLQVFGNFPVFRKLSFKSVEEWLESSNIIGGNFQHCLHLLLGKQPQNKSFLTKLLEFCNYYLANGVFRARQLHNCPPSLKLKILLGLLERQLIVNKQLKRFLNCGSDKLRVHPIGQDRLGNLYWHFVDRELNVRVFRLHSIQKDDEQWTLVVKDRESFEKLIASLEELFENFDQSGADSTSLGGSMVDASTDDKEDCRNFLDRNEEVSDMTIERASSLQETFECENCKKIVPRVLPSQLNENQNLYCLMEMNKICATCKHKMLMDNLEEKFFFYLESLGGLTSLDPIVRNYSEIVINEQPQHKEPEAVQVPQTDPSSDEMLVTSNDMMMPDSVAEDKEPELYPPLPPPVTAAVADSPDEPHNENIPDSSIPTPIQEAAPIEFSEDVPSSPSEFEDNEIEDPSVEFDLYELSEDDDDDDYVEIDEELLDKKKEKTKARAQGLRSKNSRITNKKKLPPPSFWQQSPIGQGRVTKQRTTNNFYRTMSLPTPKSNLRTHSSMSSSQTPPFYNQSTSAMLRQNNAAKKSSSFSINMQSSHNNYERDSVIDSLIRGGNKISKIGNSTSFVGTLAGSRNTTPKKFQTTPARKTHFTSTPRKFVPHSGDGRYNNAYNENKDGFEDFDDYENDDDETVATNEDEDWTWEDYEETCAHEDYASYDDCGGDYEELQDEGAPEECYDDQNLEYRDDDDDNHVHVIDSDGEEDGTYQQDDDPYICDDDNDGIVDTTDDNNHSASYHHHNEVYDIDENDEDDYHDPSKSYDVPPKEEIRRSGFKSEGRVPPTSEDECFVVEMIE